jgi:hypothetical protein
MDHTDGSHRCLYFAEDSHSNFGQVCYFTNNLGIITSVMTKLAAKMGGGLLDSVPFLIATPVSRFNLSHSSVMRVPIHEMYSLFSESGSCGLHA